MAFDRRLLRNVARRVSPRHREWDRLLAGLTWDPDDRPGELPAPDPRSFLMCGSPRSGTALLVAMLFRPPDVVTVMEPWDALRLPPADLMASLRDEVQSGSLTRGRLDIEALRASGDVTWRRDGGGSSPVEVGPDFLLGAKMPAFWRYLDRLPTTRFLVCLRDPVEVVGSYARTGGRLRQGLDYDVAFNRRMNDHLERASSDVAVRRVLLYDYIHERMLPFLDHPNVHVVRYERWFTEPEQQFHEITRFLGLDLQLSDVRLRPPESSGEDREIRSLVEEHCRTASALGYGS